MAAFVKGDVVVVPFPFSDLSTAKRRPALVLASLEGDDIILCQVTSRMIKDSYSIQIDDSSFKTGGLQQTSNIRPNKIFTADSNIVLYSAGTLKQDMMLSVTQRVIDILTNSSLVNE